MCSRDIFTFYSDVELDHFIIISLFIILVHLSVLVDMVRWSDE